MHINILSTSDNVFWLETLQVKVENWNDPRQVKPKSVEVIK